VATGDHARARWHVVTLVDVFENFNYVLTALFTVEVTAVGIPLMSDTEALAAVVHAGFRMLSISRSYHTIANHHSTPLSRTATQR
jgi:hypothetical protein